MVIPEGYKKTEIGVIPEDWEVNCFKNVGSFFKGSGISMKDTKPTGLPCIMYGDIYVKFDTHFTKCDFKIDENTANKSTRAITNDLFFTASGETTEEIGKCVSYQGAKDIYIGGDIIAIRPTNKYDSLFLAFVQNSSLLIKQKASLAQGHTVVHINSNNIASLQFAYPELKEQQQIAQSLLDVDGLVSSLEKLIEKKKAIKQGAMQELLTGKKRLPGFTGEWDYMELGKCGVLLKESINPQAHPLHYFWEYSMPAFDIDKCPNKQLGVDMHSNRTIIKGTVLLFNKLNVRQKRIWLIENCREDAVCSSEFLPYQSTQINLDLLVHILHTDKVTLDFIGMSTGTSNSQKRITPDSFLEYKVFLPTDKEEQTAIASILSDMDNEIDALEQKLKKARQLKQGMMQQLLTGKIRLV